MTSSRTPSPWPWTPAGRRSATILWLFGLAPEEFDGKVETLLGLTVPEDLPSLMSVTESDHMTIGERELEFRVLQPTGPPKWLRLSGRLLPGGDGSADPPGRHRRRRFHAAPGRDRRRPRPAPRRRARHRRDRPRRQPGRRRRPRPARGPTASPWPSWRTTGSSSPSSTRPTPKSWPELWRLEWRTEWPDAPVRAMPTLAAALREGRALDLARRHRRPGGPRRRRPRRPGRTSPAGRPHGRRLPDRLGHPARLRPRRARPADRLGGAGRAGPDARPRLRRRTRAGRHAPAPAAAAPAAEAPRSPSPVTCPAPRAWSWAATGTT
ncbi:hypothetical protein STENM327S_04675 [Streptomyces tendae]